MDDMSSVTVDHSHRAGSAALPAVTDASPGDSCSAGGFFAPAPTDAIEVLLAQYQVQRSHIEQICRTVEGEAFRQAFHYFSEGNATQERGRTALTLSCEQMFEPKGAIGALNAAFWSKALQLTDVLDFMPQARRDQWNRSISNPCGIRTTRRSFEPVTTEWEVEPLPDFSGAAVRSTIEGLLGMRAKFLAERVEGIFRGLSGDHVTNAPEGFGRRMILARAMSEYGSVDHSTAGLINDLRCVVAKFMGRDEPKWYLSSRLIEELKGRWGEWVSCDGGALRVRLYKKGTAHLEVHPDIAYRLNQILAYLYPSAIPAQFRRKPARRPKEFPLLSQPLPFAVLELLGELRAVRSRPNAMMLNEFGPRSKVALEEARRVLAMLGGVEERSGVFDFDYAPQEVIAEVITSGCVPEIRSHQFYPTPTDLAQTAIDLAGIQDHHQCLEPSAGTGALARLMPAERTVCVEVSRMHCSVLQAQGLKVAHADFLAWSLQAKAVFDVVVMNPPFSEGRWSAHLDAALRLLAPQGRLVAILPASARGHELPQDVRAAWHGPYCNAFPGVSVTVVILVASRA